MMSWEDTIRHIRSQPAYADLIKFAYLDEDLEKNVHRFVHSTEWKETCGLIRDKVPKGGHVLDAGCGNGISSVAFALKGYEVTALDPDPSDTVGIGAVKILKEKLNLHNIHAVEGFAETVNFDTTFDLIYCRQAMHHASNLNGFVENQARMLKKGGYFLTVRDHIVFDDNDKKWFLATHPLQEFYGGENAFSAGEYREAFQKAGLRIVKEMKHFESPINYFPLQEQDLEIRKKMPDQIRLKLKARLGAFLGAMELTQWLYKKIVFDSSDLLNERKIPGRMYSYLAYKA